MDSVLASLESMHWGFGDSDPIALAELKRRISLRARTSRPQQTYSELLQGVSFNLPTVSGGLSYEIDVHDWQPLDRQILGKFLGRINTDSYRAGRFFASTITVQAESLAPSAPFYDLAVEVGLLRDTSEAGKLSFWLEQTRVATDWFRSNPESVW